MNKLFIIGNGFDLAHHIPSKYENFRLYLIEMLNSVSGRDYSDYDFTDSSIIVNDYISSKENDILIIMYFLSNAEYIQKLVDSNFHIEKIKNVEWNNIEKSVGQFDFEPFSYLYVEGDPDNDEEYDANLTNEDILAPYVKVLSLIPEYFKKWIKQIDVDSRYTINNDIERLFDENTKFLCFNYTDTLETLYGVSRKNICYIHGKAKENNDLYFGHGNSCDYQDYISDKDINTLSTAEGEWMIDYLLQKPVEKILEQNSSFFNSLDDIR